MSADISVLYGRLNNYYCQTYVCMYVYMHYICLYVCMFFMFACVHMCTFVCWPICHVFVCLWTYEFVCTHAWSLNYVHIPNSLFSKLLIGSHWTLFLKSACITESIAQHRHFNHNDGGGTLLRNRYQHIEYAVSRTRRPQSEYWNKFCYAVFWKTSRNTDIT
jgi:hypothetical protein